MSTLVKMQDKNGTPIDETNPFAVQLTGSLMEQFIANDAATKPAVSSVPIGCVLISVATQNAWMSDGTSWIPC